MPILAVDPEALFAAGSAVVATGDGLAAAMAVLAAGFGANTGLDVAGEVFGLSYQGTAESLVTAAAAAVNACRRNGVMVQVDASNWSQAEAASNLHGGVSVLRAPPEPAKISAPGPPGLFIVTDSDPMGPEHFILAAPLMTTIERYFFGKFGLEIRSQQDLPRVKMPISAEELTPGFRMETRRFGDAEHWALIAPDNTLVAIGSADQITGTADLA